MLSGMNITTIAFAGLLIFQTVQPYYRPPLQSSDIEGLVRALQAIQLQHTTELERLKARMERLEKVVKKLCEDAPRTFISDCIALEGGSTGVALRYPATARDLSVFAPQTVLDDLNTVIDRHPTVRNCPERKKTLYGKNGKLVQPMDGYWLCQLAYYQYEMSLRNEFEQKLKVFVANVNPQAVLGEAYKNF